MEASRLKGIIMDYTDMALGAVQAHYEEIQQYTDRDSRFLPIRITHDSRQYILLGASGNNSQLILAEVAQATLIQTPKQIDVDNPLIVNDCVMLCKTILGLKVNEVAKLVGVSRATLDLHRKGANVKNMAEYQKLYDFVENINSTYGDTIKNGLRNVLIKRKTLLQHFMLNKDDFSKNYSYIEEVAAKLGNMNIIKTEIDESKANLRLTSIGRLA
jgi:hypothetical protein